MSSFVPAPPSFNDQSHIDPSSTNTSIFNTDSLTPFEIGLLMNPPYILNVDLDILLNPTYYQRENCLNSFVLFRKNFSSGLRSQFPNKSYTIHEISEIANDQWNMQPDANQSGKEEWEILE
ncbi:1951_t:CDS:2 [Paraglomus occultum]|uniref:1951_t:CDS:1 n=1 Tax=Paraglomus occultum TaxID=144539 RepID=A0A9N8ZD67_9GLOM|nr:1951_t:CDS:2 [Paraglomus occultum]